MVFGLFGKKKEVVDFRPRDSDMPIPSKMKEKLIGGNNPITSTYTPEESNTPTPSSSTTSSSGGGFFGFFGGGNDSSSSTNSTTTPTQTNSTQVDFWGNPVNTPAVESNTSSESNSQLNDVLYRLSRIADRLELVEKKIDRLERRNGANSESYS